MNLQLCLHKTTSFSSFKLKTLDAMIKKAEYSALQIKPTFWPFMKQNRVTLTAEKAP